MASAASSSTPRPRWARQICKSFATTSSLTVSLDIPVPGSCKINPASPTAMTTATSPQAADCGGYPHAGASMSKFATKIEEMFGSLWQSAAREKAKPGESEEKEDRQGETPEEIENRRACAFSPGPAKLDYLKNDLTTCHPLDLFVRQFRINRQAETFARGFFRHRKSPRGGRARRSISGGATAGDNAARSRFCSPPGVF